MSSTGLSRRRVAGTTSPSNDATTQPTSNGTPPNSGGLVAHAGSAFEGGNKIAFDPRDLENDSEDARQGGKMPRLTLMEEVLLLGIKDKQVGFADIFTSSSYTLAQRFPGNAVSRNILFTLFLQGYLSFWNDNISYALRGCILIELALRRRIALVKDPLRKRIPLPDRLVEVIDNRQTGETILDETLKMMKAQTEKMAINSWIDLLSGEPICVFNYLGWRSLSCSWNVLNTFFSGETWNVMKIGYQLKQVRERLAKGLVDKGVLRTEKRNFLLFDMATHPVADVRIKESIVSRAVSLLTASTATVPPAALDKEGTQCRAMRAVCLVSTSYAASVLDNAFGRLQYEHREAAFQRCDEILAEFSCWPFGSHSGGSGNSRRRTASRVAMGSETTGRDSIVGLLQEVKKEMLGEEDLGFELVAGVLEVLSKLDSIL
jgi:Golgi phosphoprotein 3